MKLTVKPLKQKDAGRGLAAIDRVSMNELDLENGDYIVITGSGDGQAVARVWPGYPEDEGRGIVRIDGRLRQEPTSGSMTTSRSNPRTSNPRNRSPSRSRRTSAFAVTSARSSATSFRARPSPRARRFRSRSRSARWPAPASRCR